MSLAPPLSRASSAGPSQDRIVLKDWSGPAETACERGRALHERGALTEAEAIYREILRQLPTHHDSLHLLGMLAHQAGTPAKAVDLIGQAVGLCPDAAHYRCNLANALRDLGRHAEAMLQYQEAERLRPDAAEIRCNLGTVLLDLGRLDEAVACYRAARQLDPSRPELHYNLANALGRLGKFPLAEQSYRTCLALSPAHADAHYNFAGLLARQNQLAEAEASYRAAIAIRPGSASAWNNLGVVLQRTGRLTEAASCHKQAAILAPDEAEHYYNLGCAELARNATKKAAGYYMRALEADPRHAASRFAHCMAELPILYGSEPEIRRSRAAYAEKLTSLCREAEQSRTPHNLAPGVGASLPFMLAYQGLDDLELQRSHGNLVCRVMAAAVPAAPLPAFPASGERIRVGIVSAFFHEHKLWSTILEGWTQELDTTRFSLTAYHTGARRDAVTTKAALRCTRFVQGPLSPDEWRQTILADAPHVLLYPEIGIDPIAARLGAQRLAPVQCVAWGHPVTTGMPSIDHFLSGEALEPDAADAQYAENLVRLPGLGTYLEPPRRSDFGARGEYGLREEAAVYWCGQPLIQFLPQHDGIFPRIAGAVREAQFVFVASDREEITALFRHRLRQAFGAHGLDADWYCVFLPPDETQGGSQGLHCAAGLADVVLDTIGWSGMESVVGALAYDAPIVTLPGPLMRSRTAAGMLRLMNAPETIAKTTDEFIQIAINLGRDDGWRGAVIARLTANKRRLFRNMEAIEALEALMVRSVQVLKPRPARDARRPALLPGHPGRPGSGRRRIAKIIPGCGPG